MTDDLEWAETLGKSAGQVNRTIKRLRARETALVDALTKCVTSMDAHNYTVRHYSNLDCGFNFGAGFGGTIDIARKALSTLDEG